MSNQNQNQPMTQNQLDELIAKYPQLKKVASNQALLRNLIPTLEPVMTLKDAKLGSNLKNLEILFARVLGAKDYRGCSICFSKLDGEEGTSMPCNSGKCQGDIRVIKNYKIWRLLGGDNAANAIFVFLPFYYELDDPNALEGKFALVTGFVKDITKNKRDGSETLVITVKDLDVQSDIKKPKAQSSQPTQSKSNTNTNSASIEQLEQVKLLFHINRNHISESALEMNLRRMGIEMATINPYLVKQDENGAVFYAIKDAA